ncbi:MAG TPA: restriction endonuclease [Porphyromonadaceae bacterium]|nr:restriction endonuclease [Porphyromonadaceae bacterium]
MDKIILNNKDYTSLVFKAVRFFWRTKSRQLSDSDDSSNRGAVVGGKQMDGFIELLKEVAIDAGIPEDYIITDKNYLPGFFRSSKDWDMLIIAPSGKLIAAIELKSQVGSYGNNFNNRTEEAIGSAVDLWTAFREGQFPGQQAPWVGWLMLVGRDKASERIVRNYEPHFPVRPEFETASYLDRYRILCQKLILERHYTSTALVWTRDVNTYGNLAEDISIQRFIASLANYLNGVKDEFK